MNMEKLAGFPIKDIVILDSYKSTSPSERKMKRKEGIFLERGNLPFDIVINDDNVLIDGYVTYLLAVKHGIERLDVKRGYIEIVEASHRDGSRTYQWRVPGRLQGKIAKGEKVLVCTHSGLRRVKVENVIKVQYPPNEGHLRYVHRMA